MHAPQRRPYGTDLAQELAQLLLVGALFGEEPLECRLLVHQILTQAHRLDPHDLEERLSPAALISRKLEGLREIQDVAWPWIVVQLGHPREAHPLAVEVTLDLGLR